MTTAGLLATPALHPLEPVRESALAVAHGAPLMSLGDGRDEADWYPGTWLTAPTMPVLTDLLDDIGRRWGLGRHAAAAIAFKGYAWSATVPVVVGWLGHGRVPVLSSDDIRVGIADRLPYVRLDLDDATVVVEAGDPLAEHPQAHTATGSAELAHAARDSLLGGHLADVVATLQRASRMGTRPLWGSVAEAVAVCAMALPGDEPVERARTALATLGRSVAGLVEVVDDGGRPAVRRKTCCLWFTGEAGRDTYCSTCCVVRQS